MQFITDNYLEHAGENSKTDDRFLLGIEGGPKPVAKTHANVLSGIGIHSNQGKTRDKKRQRNGICSHSCVVSPLMSWESPALTLIAFLMCGIVGIALREGSAALNLYEALLMLQHRGQDAAGMVTLDQGKFHERKKNGLVSDVFAERHFEKLQGPIGIGHVRYPTAGTQSAREAQPFFTNAPFGIFMVHNGNLTNTDDLRTLAQTRQRRHFRTSSDTEVLLALMADEIQLFYTSNPLAKKQDAIFSGLRALMEKAKGSYSSLALIDKVGLVAFRDPFGVRPLCLGQRKTAEGNVEYSVASESIAFEALGYTLLRDVAPGEAILIDREGELHTQQLVAGKLKPCIFEYIYLARPDSRLSGISVYEFQRACGRKLARQLNQTSWDIDVVVPVPDGARPAAMEVARRMGIDYGEGLIKNRYVGRTFIMPDQQARERSVKRKLNANPAVLKGRKILLIDDSIVRGTTMRKIVDLCREAGASKVYVASASPPVRHPNVYGVDLPSRDEFVAADLPVDAICEELCADGLIYQTLSDLRACGTELNPEVDDFEDSVFSGNYVAGSLSDNYLEALAKGRGAGRGVQRRLPLTTTVEI